MTEKTGRRVRKKPADLIEETPYQILEISESSSSKEIRKAYLHKLHLSPPERDPEGFKKIHGAYTRLKDSAGRKELDFSLFKTESELDIDRNTECDFTSLFEDRIFQIFLSSSDLYIKDFKRDFRYIEENIKKLQ